MFISLRFGLVNILHILSIARSRINSVSSFAKEHRKGSILFYFILCDDYNKENSKIITTKWCYIIEEALPESKVYKCMLLHVYSRYYI